MSNNKYNEEIRKYEAAAEEHYEDFDGEEHFDTGLEGYEEGYEDQYEDNYEEVSYIGAEEGYEDHYEEFDDFNGTSIGKIDPNDRTLTIVVSNTGAADAEAVIFGANENAAQPAGITVDVLESSHNEVREESKANPFKIQGMKMSVNDNTQFDNVWRIWRRTSSGSQTSHIYQPRNATSPQNNNPNLIDDAAFETDVTGQHSIRFIQKAGTKSTITFTVKARVDMGNVLAGQNVARLSSAPRATGLPQLDLPRIQGSPVFGIRPRPRRMVRRVFSKPAGGAPFVPDKSNQIIGTQTSPVPGRPANPNQPRRRFFRRRRRH